MGEEIIVREILWNPSTQSVVEERYLPVPPEVGLERVLAFLEERLGEAVDTTWTTTPRHPRVTVGWVFEDPDGRPGIELRAIPSIRDEHGTLIPIFVKQADLQQEFEQLFEEGALDRLEITEIPQED